MIRVRRLVLSMLVLAFAPVSALAGSPPAVTAADRFVGRADAPVTVVEYASFACSHCADWHLVVYPEFKRRFIDTGQVRLVFRNLPTAISTVGLLGVPVVALAVSVLFLGESLTLSLGIGLCLILGGIAAVTLSRG